MAYHTYENWRARGHKAVVHLDSCGFCNHGQGLAGGTRTSNGQWHGPFNLLAKALKAVAGVSPTVHECVQ
jgi:hypothetical protein